MTDPIVPDRRPKILLLAYLCSPYHGSEATIGWNFAVGLAEHCDVWVITLGDSYRSDVRRYARKHGLPAGLHFRWVYRPPWLRRLRRVPGMYYAAYNLWHRRAFRAAKRLHAKTRFDLVHQLNLCGYREPGYLWKLDAPFVWGPLGGTQNFPWRFLPEVGISGAIAEAMRNVVNAAQLRFSSRVRRAARSASALFTANSTNWRDFRRVHGAAPELLLEAGVNEVAARPRPVQPRRPLRLLWSGRVAPSKGLSLLLKALRRLPEDFSWELRIVGEGPVRSRYQRLARNLGIQDRITWTGWLSRAKAIQQNDWADVFVFTSLRDTSGNVMLEALSAGVPVLCLDHQGAADIVTEDCGIKIPVTHSRQVVRDLAAAILHLAEAPGRRQMLSEGALRRAADFLWSRRVDRVAAAYRTILGIPTVISKTRELHEQLS